MNNQIMSRGWLWDKSEKPTQWKVHSCVRCNDVNTFPIIENLHPYCKICGHGYFPLGYVRKIKQVKEIRK